MRSLSVSGVVCLLLTDPILCRRRASLRHLQPSQEIGHGKWDNEDGERPEESQEAIHSLPPSGGDAERR
jgi:hypothetical protein